MWKHEWRKRNYSTETHESSATMWNKAKLSGRRKGLGIEGKRKKMVETEEEEGKFKKQLWGRKIRIYDTFKINYLSEIQHCAKWQHPNNNFLIRKS